MIYPVERVEGCLCVGSTGGRAIVATYKNNTNNTLLL